MVSGLLLLKPLLQFAIEIPKAFIALIVQKQAIRQTIGFPVLDHAGTTPIVIFTRLFRAGALGHIRATQATHPLSPTLRKPAVTWLGFFQYRSVVTEPFAFHTTAAQHEVDPWLLGLFFPDNRLLRALPVHSTDFASLAFFWIHQCSFHYMPPNSTSRFRIAPH